MEQLGVESKLLLAQIVNFSIIIFILSKLLYKPILDILDKRKAEIQKGLELTQKMQNEHEALQVKQQKILEEARRDAKKVIDEAVKQARDKEKEILSQAHVQSQSIIDKAGEEVRQLHDKLKVDLKKEAVDLAVVMTKRVIGSVLKSDDQHRIIAQNIKDLKKL